MRRTKIAVGWFALLVCPLLFVTGCAGRVEPEDVSAELTPVDYPESGEIAELLSARSPPPGLFFNVMEYDADALEWVTVRLKQYVHRLRAQYPDLPIAVVSHGNEMFALRSDDRWLYPEVHERVQTLVERDDVIFHVCGANAAVNGVDQSEFPQYVDVVPLATSQIRDYREFGYRMISMQITW
jgi:intracellular sulfur oxidation DsrE/DsrF family protein